MDSQSDALVQFCGVTTATPDQARFYLESSDWKLEPALQLFYESDAGQGRATPLNMADYDLTEDENMSNHSFGSTLPGSAALQGNALDSIWNPALAPDPPQGVGLSTCRPKGKETGKKSAAPSRGLVTTLRDIGKHQDSDSDSDGPQEYYTGGEKSGMMVQDPTKKPKHPDVESIFERVRKLGAQEGPSAEPPRAAASPSANLKIFSGASRTLTGEPRQQEQATARAGPRAPPEPVVHNIQFWRNGFTVDQGPLRRIDDPVNLPFLESIRRSECPRELEQAAGSNVPVHVNLVKRDEEWQAPPEPKYVPFKGLGHTLGNASQSPDAVTSAPAPREDASRPPQGLVLDDAKPATSIQLRLSDGTRMVARFNTTHTVEDIRGFIDAARPGNSGPYQLQTMGFPPTKLTDLKQTIEGAGLLNAVVIQKC